MSDDIRHETANVNGTRLHWAASGEEGSPVLLVHGFPETWYAFRRVIPILARRHRVVAVDLRGIGASSVAEATYTSAVAAEDLHALIEHLGMGPVHLVGQDLSGAAVYRLAAAHPADVLSLTAIESTLAGFGAEALTDVANGGAWYIGALATPGVAELLFDGRAEGFIADHLYPLYGVALDGAARREFVGGYDRAGGFLGAAGLYRSMVSEADELRELSRTRPIGVPVTAVGSAGGSFTHDSFAAAVGREVRSERVDGVGHYLAQEAPERLSAVLGEVFAAIDGA